MKRIHLAVLLLPILSLLLLIIASRPMMHPGFDVWIHLAKIEYAPTGTRTWYDIWKHAFEVLHIANVFDRALLIHRTQLFLTSAFIGLAAYWLLLTVFAQSNINKSVLILQSLCAVWIWLVMHGTVSVPVAGNRAFFQAWVMWYSVNYQIALPIYFASAAALVFSTMGNLSVNNRVLLILFSILGALTIAKIHPSELPYLIVMGFLLLVLGFRWQHRWWYVFGLIAAGFALYAAIKWDGRLPHGFYIYKSEGIRGVYSAILNNGEWVVNKGNRGQASFNFYHYMGVASTMLALLFSLKIAKINIKAIWFVFLSSISIAALFLKIPAGLLTMITNHEIAWRFSFSSFLFLGVPILSIILGLRYSKLSGIWTQLALSGGIVFSVMAASFLWEPHHVAYQYTRSIVHSLNPAKIHFGLPPNTEDWLKKTNEVITQEIREGYICTDIFSAYYLYFVHGQRKVNMPGTIDFPGDCRFPRDGGDLKRLPIEPPPWTF